MFDHADENDEEKELASQISQAWNQLRKDGVPGTDEMPEWEPYTRDGGAT